MGAMTRTIETHISRVHLFEHDVYKLKKPVFLGFLDFRTLEARHAACEAEVALNAHLEGGCQVPIGGYAELDGATLRLRGLVGDPDGSVIVEGEMRGAPTAAEDLGARLAADLLARGADAILAKVYGRA